MKQTLAERVLRTMAYAGLYSGIIFGFLYAKGIWESGTEMCVPTAVMTFFSAVFFSVVGWAVLMTVVTIAERAANIEKMLKDNAELERRKCEESTNNK